MEKLKSLDEITEPDPRHKGFVRIDPSTPGFKRPLTLADQYARVADLELADSVPESVRSAFAVARMLWIHGWFYWPFYTLASFHAYLCLDLALLIKIKETDGITDPNWPSPPLTKMLRRAVDERWITDERIPHAQRSRDHAREFVDSLPEELQSMFGPSYWDESDQYYCRILMDIVPQLRNAFAHPKKYWHGAYGSPRLDLENVYGIIQQLFG